MDDRRTGGSPVVGSFPLGFEPTEFNMESGGVIWMQGRRHLVRFDPKMRLPPQIPLRGQITSVQLPESNRQLFNRVRCCHP